MRSICSGLGLLALAAGCTGTISTPSGSGPGSSNVSGTAGSGAGVAGGGGTTEPAAQGGPVLRRLTASQYWASVRDVLGEPLPQVALDGEPAVHGFTSVGASTIVTSPLGVERYDAAARAIAAQIMSDATRRSALVGCVPQGPGDAVCTRSFLSGVGRKLYRRTLTAVELDRVVSLATAAASGAADFWRGTEAGLAALLSSPKFLYRAELGVAGSDGLPRYTSVELAARLSYFIWSSGPDSELLDAGERGELESPEYRRAQALRLLATDKARTALRHFFAELIRIDDPAGASAAGSTLPASLRSAMYEQALRTFDESMLQRHETYGQLVRSPTTYLNDELAEHYGLPQPGSAELVPVELAASTGRLGLLGLGALLMKQANPPNTSPTGRGKFVREALLCEVVPPPPPGVETELPEVPEGVQVSMKERLSQHRTDPNCAGCHSLMDPIGLGLENLDAFGRYRSEDRGLPIDASGELDGVAFRDGYELSTAVSNHPSLAACFTKQVGRFLTGQAEPHVSLEPIAAEYAASGGSLPQLFVRFVESDLFSHAYGEQASAP
jgi:hypothetical protein